MGSIKKRPTMRIPVDPDFNEYTPLFWAFALWVMVAAYAASLV